MKTTKFYKSLLCFLPILSISCSVGSSQSQKAPPLSPDTEYSIFNESYITMPLESSVILTVYLMNPINSEPIYFKFYADESGVVEFNPESCYFDLTQPTPSCSTIMYSIGVGKTNVSILSRTIFPEDPLEVVVTNN